MAKGQPGPVGEGLTWNITEDLKDEVPSHLQRKASSPRGAHFADMPASEISLPGTEFLTSRLMSTLTASSTSKAKAGGLVARSGKSVSVATMRKAFQTLGSSPDSEGLELENVMEAIKHKVPPNQFLQLLVIIRRAALKQFRDFYPTAVIDACLLMSTACVVGAVHGAKSGPEKTASNGVMAMTALATLTGVTFLRTFVKVCSM
jgi:hypothetical protein